MRWLINYLRQCFCKHDFNIEEMAYVRIRYGGDEKIKNIVVSQTCKKCGYHKGYYKFPF
jgi:hypothetical protein